VTLALRFALLRLRLGVLTKTLWLVAALLAFKVAYDPLIAGLLRRRHGFAGWVANLAQAPIRDVAETVYNSVESKLSLEAAHHLRPVTKWIRTYASREATVIGALAAVATATAGALERGFGVTLPREIGKATRPIDRRARRALKGAIAAGLAGAALRKWIHGEVYGNIRPQLRHLAHAADVTLPRELGRIRARERTLEHDLAHPSSRWLRRVAGAMFGLVGAAWLIRSLARRFPWLFCRNVKTAGKRLCGLDAKLFESLLSDVLAISGTISIVAFARELRPFVDEFGTLIVRFFRELGIDPRDYLGSAGRSRDGVIPFLPLRPGDYL
jgi:hypothetical protein